MRPLLEPTRRARARALRAGAATFGALAATLFPSPARAELKLKWDCYLPSSNVDCAVIEGSLLSKIPFLRTMATRADADVAITLTSVPAEGGTRYLFHFEGPKREGYETDVHTMDKIPDSIDAPTATVRIMTRLERGVAEFMDQKVAAEVKNGALAIRLLDPKRLPFEGRREQDGVKWYLAPGIALNFSQIQGVGVNANGGASVFYNYSAARWRAQQWIGANYTQQSQPVAGTDETASISFVGANANNVLSRALSADNRWSVALLLAAEKTPQANFRMRANGSAGLEYDLIPRQTVNMRNLGFRCAVGPEYQHYDALNVQGIAQQVVARQFCDVFVSWHFAPVDVSGSLSETSILESIDYRSFALSLSATWRVTDDFVLSPWVNLQQINKAINEAEPTNAVFADARQEVEASMIAAIEQSYTSPFGVQAGLSVRFLFGNGSLNSEDQRWRGTSNLR